MSIDSDNHIVEYTYMHAPPSKFNRFSHTHVHMHSPMLFKCTYACTHNNKDSIRIGLVTYPIVSNIIY